MLLVPVLQGNGPETVVTKPAVSHSFASRTSPLQLSPSLRVPACEVGGVNFLWGRPPFNTRVQHGVSMHHIVALNIEPWRRLDGNILSKTNLENRKFIWNAGMHVCKVLKTVLQNIVTSMNRKGDHASPLQERYTTPFSWNIFVYTLVLACIHCVFTLQKIYYFENRHAKIGMRLFCRSRKRSRGSKPHWQIEFV